MPSQVIRDLLYRSSNISSMPALVCIGSAVLHRLITQTGCAHELCDSEDRLTSNSGAGYTTSD